MLAEQLILYVVDKYLLLTCDKKCFDAIYMNIFIRLSKTQRDNEQEIKSCNTRIIVFEIQIYYFVSMLYILINII